MRTSFELLEDVVRVEVVEYIANERVGITSFVVSYEAFTSYLKSVERQKAVSGSGKGNELNMLTRYWSNGQGEVGVPEGTVEINTATGEELHIRQQIGGNNLPILKVGEYEIDTSRLIVDFKINAGDKIVRDVRVSTFTGLMYGFHKPDNIVPNEFMTLKLKEDMEGMVVRRLSEINTKEKVKNIQPKDIRRSTDNSFTREVGRVKEEGGNIQWQGVRC